MAGDNEDQKQKIAEKYEKRKADIQRKAARTEKATALFQIAIDTGKAIVANLKTPLLLPWVIATAAVQAAMVAARPIPQYAKGVLSSGSGPAIVGEMGSELMIGPDGRVSLSGPSAELVNLERGTRIIPSDETKMILASATAARGISGEGATERRHKELIKAINEKESIILPATTGQPITMRKGNTYKEYFNRHLQ